MQPLYRIRRSLNKHSELKPPTGSYVLPLDPNPCHAHGVLPTGPITTCCPGGPGEGGGGIEIFSPNYYDRGVQLDNLCSRIGS